MVMGVPLAALALTSSGLGCFVAARDLPVGAVLTVDDVRPVACRTMSGRAPLRYDRVRGVAVVGTPVAAGHYLGRVMPTSKGRVEQGARLTLRATVGPVTVERAVVAMQPGRAGRRVFVRDAEGRIFAVMLAMDGQ